MNGSGENRSGKGGCNGIEGKGGPGRGRGKLNKLLQRSLHRAIFRCVDCGNGVEIPRSAEQGRGMGGGSLPRFAVHPASQALHTLVSAPPRFDAILTT